MATTDRATLTLEDFIAEYVTPGAVYIPIPESALLRMKQLAAARFKKNGYALSTGDMSLQRILKPYRLWLSQAAIAAGFPEEASFKNKKEAREFIKKVQAVDPSYNPSLRIFFRWYDTASGRPYTNRFEYEQEQTRSQDYHRQRDALDALRAADNSPVLPDLCR